MRILTQIFPVAGPWPGRLAISARPRGGDWLHEEMSAWREAGVNVVASLLTEGEADEMELENEQAESEKNGMEFASFAIPDRTAPSPGNTLQGFLDSLNAKLNQGDRVILHCRQGVGRAGLIAAALLIETGLTPEAAIQRVSTARGVPVPETNEQRLWIESFAATLARKP